MRRPLQCLATPYRNFETTAALTSDPTSDPSPRSLSHSLFLRSIFFFRFHSNVASSGSAIYVSDAATLRASFTNFKNQTASGKGSVRALKGGSASFASSTWSANNAAEGAVARVDSGSALTLTDCTATGNAAQRGAIFSLAASAALTLTRLTARNNSASVAGFAFCDSAFPPPACAACDLFNNTASLYGPLQATEPVLATLSAPLLIRSGEAIPNFNSTMLDAFNFTVPRWPEVTWSYSVDGGAELRGQLEVLYHAGAVGPISLVGRIGQSYTLFAELSSPTVPKLSGTVLSTTVTVAACQPDEVYDELYGACLCLPGSVREASALAIAGPSGLAGTSVARGGASSAVAACAPCAPGTFSSQAGASVCLACPAGQVSAAGQSACSTCPENSTPLNASACACARGNYLVGSTCRTCPANSAVPLDVLAAFSARDCVCLSGTFKVRARTLALQKRLQRVSPSPGNASAVLLGGTCVEVAEGRVRVLCPSVSRWRSVRLR